ncbi:MAG: hypothetical protein ACLTDV_03180 [Eubacterium sp.]
MQQHFLEDGIGCFVLHGDDYPHRIPKMNDEKREQIYQENGEKGLDAYLGTPQEIGVRQNQSGTCEVSCRSTSVIPN